MIEISTSILSVEKEKSVKTFYNLEVSGTNYYHIDVMDGKFVEQNTEERMYTFVNEIKQTQISQLQFPKLKLTALKTSSKISK